MFIFYKNCYESKSSDYIYPKASKYFYFHKPMYMYVLKFLPLSYQVCLLKLAFVKAVTTVGSKWKLILPRAPTTSVQNLLSLERFTAKFNTAILN